MAEEVEMKRKEETEEEKEMRLIQILRLPIVL
jgi:hypothetical protein